MAAGTEALLDAIDRYLCPACPTPAADCPSISHSGRPFCMQVNGLTADAATPSRRSDALPSFAPRGARLL
ncbi:hypothetical protein BTHE_1897 [Bifidobacterium thermophilum]|nr:hypothetical protein BTHE_1897 [Bifidobacterium thermophilum]